MSAPWARYPSGLRHLPPDERAAWVELLDAWHEGESVSTRTLQSVTKWGVGRTLAFIARAEDWAVANGAHVPPSVEAHVAERQRSASGAVPERERSASGAPDVPRTPTIEPERSASGAPAERERSGTGAVPEHSRARLPCRDQIRDQRSTHTRADVDTSPVTVHGKTLPGDLTALLYDMNPGGRTLPQHMVSDKPNAVHTTRELLTVSEDELQYVPGFGGTPIVARRVAAFLRERWGVEPGCLAAPRPESRPEPTAESDYDVGALLAERRRKLAAEKQAGGRP